MRKTDRSGLWGTLLVLLSVLILLGLGTWQVQRMKWKAELISHIHTFLDDLPVVMPHEFPDLAQYDFVRTAIRGVFDHKKEIILGPRVFEGQTGYYVFTPLKRVSGPVVFVNRGWVPPEKVDPKTRLQGQVPGLVKVEGRLRVPPEHKPIFVPENRPEEGKWFWMDIPAMAESAGIDPKSVLPLVVYEDDRPEIAWPEGNPMTVTLPNNHLYYAIFWYCMAAVLCGIYVRLYLEHRQNRRK